jgi:hypothetical protein
MLAMPLTLQALANAFDHMQKNIASCNSFDGSQIQRMSRLLTGRSANGSV